MRRHASPGGTRPAAGRRGASLIEALVAMSVMSFGMLGVVGLQGTLRGNADLSKQRSEATRIAQEEIEKFRSFGNLAEFDAKAGFAATAVSGYATNTRYTVAGTVTPAGVAHQKTLLVEVQWTDRKGEPQRLRLVSAMARIAPELAGSMVAPPSGTGGTREGEDRRRGIPPQARSLGDGTSGFRPPQSGTNVAWVFDDRSGLITAVCATTATDNATLTPASLSGCISTQAYQLLSGHIRFATGAAQPSVTTILNPELWTPEPGIEAEVLQSAPAALAATRACFVGVVSHYATYYCALPVLSVAAGPTPAQAWSGTLRIKPASLPTLATTPAEATTAGRKVCRYRQAESYTAVNTPLAHQNLVVIAAGTGTSPIVCPSLPAATAGPGPTWPHQPAG